MLSDTNNVENDSTAALNLMVSDKQFCDLKSSKSCEFLVSTQKEDKGCTDTDTQEKYYNPAQTTSGTASSKLSLKEEQSPTLDEFLARILQHRRESKDVSEKCDERVPEKDTYSKSAFSRTRSSDSSIVRKVVDISHSHTDTPPPNYYNLRPLMVTRESVEGEDGVGDWEDKEDALSLGEKEYRSEWLRRGSDEKEEGLLKDGKHADQDEQEENSMHIYLEILPSNEWDSSYSSSKLPTDPSSKEHTVADSEPIVSSCRESTSTPESGSPLWGTSRTWSRPTEVMSPLTQPDQDNSSVIPTSKLRTNGSPPRAQNNHSKSQRQTGFSSSSRKRTSLKRLSLKRRGSSKFFMSIGANGPLPPLPIEPASDPEHEVNSDYEWASVADALSDTESDYIYTKPHDIQPVGQDSSTRRYASCSELSSASPTGLLKESPKHHSINERPPAPLPIYNPGD